MRDVKLFALPGNELLGEALAARLAPPVGHFEVRRFPDAEWYVRIDDAVEDTSCILLATLDRPDAKILPVLFAARALRDAGARSVGLVAPYLSYLRQDRRFREGEAITSRDFAAILGREIDWLVAVDPHLHRYGSLAEIYRVPTRIAHAAPLLGDWILAHVDRPLLIGPDVESRQWVAEVANRAGAPFIVLEKVRRGDRDVSVSAPGIESLPGRTPVLVDDIISTGRTMLVAVEQLVAAGAPAPVCLGIHGVFADGAEAALRRAGAGAIATTNTVPNPTSVIDVAGILSDVTQGLIATFNTPSR